MWRREYYSTTTYQFFFLFCFSYAKIVGMQIFLKGISFHCILLDCIHEEEETKRNAIFQHFQHELDAGSIKPIVRNVFKDNEVEDAFRYD